jgi:hypothetical protein
MSLASKISDVVLAIASSIKDLISRVDVIESANNINHVENTMRQSSALIKTQDIYLKQHIKNRKFHE